MDIGGGDFTAKTPKHSNQQSMRGRSVSVCLSLPSSMRQVQQQYYLACWVWCCPQLRCICSNCLISEQDEQIHLLLLPYVITTSSLLSLFFFKKIDSSTSSTSLLRFEEGLPYLDNKLNKIYQNFHINGIKEEVSLEPRLTSPLT